jgi:hypothetical protein
MRFDLSKKNPDRSNGVQVPNLYTVEKMVRLVSSAEHERDLLALLCGVAIRQKQPVLP